MKKQDEGFTLIELLIVIVILGILATVVVFAVRGITDDSRENACQTDARTLAVAAEAYFAQEGGSSIPDAGGTDGVEETLVSAELLRDVSSNYNLETSGEVVAQSTQCQ